MTIAALAIKPAENEPYKFMHLSINDGLSNNQVKAILKDSQGFMWFGTVRGLNRFDGINFKVYRHDLYDSTSIPFNNIDFLIEDFDGKIWMKSLQDFVIFDPGLESFTRPGHFYKQTKIPVNSLEKLFRDKEGNTWFLTRNRGLFRYNPVEDKVDSLEHIANDTTSIDVQSYVAMDEDSKGDFWLVTNTGIVEKMDHATKKVAQRFDLSNRFGSEVFTFRLFVDRDDNVWVYSPGQPYGAFFIDQSTGLIIHCGTNEARFKLNNNLVSSIVQDEHGIIWLGTDHGGINLVDKKNGTVKYLVNNPDDEYSVCQNSVNYLYKDSENIIWAGTFKRGISYYHENLVLFQHYHNMPSDPGSLPYNDVNCFVEDKKGNLWIGTNGGGLLYFDRKNNSFQSYKHNSNDPESLSNNIIISLCIDRNEKLWIGTYFGGLDRFDGKVFHHHRHDPNNPSSLSDNRVWKIFEDSRHNLWIGTLNGGLDLYDRDKDVFYHNLATDMNSVGSNFIISIMEDSEGFLWMGTSDGVDRLNLFTKRFDHFTPEPGIPGKLSDKNVVDIHEDGRGYIWIGTHEGLNVYSKTEKKFRVFTENDGLPDSNIKTILEDQQNNLWVATTNGISRIEVVNAPEHATLDQMKIRVANYDIMDGLQGKEFNENAAYRTKAGELIFGGSNGFNLFNPEQLGEQHPNNKIVLTSFKVFNQEVPVGVPFRNRVILDKSITQQNEITLHHNENVFSFGFAALNFFQPEKNSFQYQLQGFNNEWLKSDVHNSEATFTNLNAGEYLFRVRVSGDGGSHWQEMNPPLKIIITPPFWLSKWAYAVYFVFSVLILLVARRILVERERLKFAAEQEHQEAVRIQQLDTLKTKFFTNISHEFRTPLTLILSPLEKLIQQSENDKLKNQYIFIHRHARRLLAMVNQLLDFRKMELQKVEAKKSWGDLIDFVREVGASFQDLADGKRINFKFKSNKDELYTYFDQDKVEKIVSNLLSNAFKFTAEKGKIKLLVSLEESEKSGEGVVEIVVKDNGIGIPEEKQEQIFDRFFQNDLPSSFVNQGSGIGLSLVSEYVAILGGTIEVKSTEEKGSSFIVRIPVQLFSEAEIVEINQTAEKKQTISYFRESRLLSKNEPRHDTSKKSILLAEDNEDFRFYLKDNLRGNFNIYEAGDGKKAWELIKKQLPDLVVSDVMMPLMDGLELCEKIKADGRTTQIPVILLTAKTETEQALDGFESGADDYISKPFDFRILESRIENLIHSRERLRISYQTMLNLSPEKVAVDSQEEKLLNKALDVVEKNMENASFSVEDLSRELGMSRVSLYKKLTQLTSKSPVEFIRIIRLKRAADLCENSQLSVSEIAYRCGFNSPRYFSKYFKQTYKKLPSEYIAEHRRKENRASTEL
ncbi:MAG TPA: two-component regulator propeller domain-containing protein [Sunxiuqinia sp.]|nr:two-component regulator propeller domain-containing protein [Sunxiuqinia sp.]